MADTGEMVAEAAQSVAMKAEPTSRAVSCLELPSFSEACGLVDSPYSCLVVQTHRRHLALPPRFLNRKRSGIQEQLTGELLRYSSRLQGVPVAYDNIKIVGELGDIHDDLGFIHLTIQADFVIFQPQQRQKLLGVVNKVAPSHIGCLVHGCFNASIPKPSKMPIEAWQHIGVKIGDHMEFEVSRLDSDAVGVFCIRGWLDEKIGAEALRKLNEVAKENDPEISSDNTARTPEDADKEAANETVEIPEDTPKKKAKKRRIQETMPGNVIGTSEGWSEPSTSLEGFPKKKKKKKLQELNSQADTVEVDSSIENSALDNGIVESLRVDNISKTAERKKKLKNSLPSTETDGHIQTQESLLSRFDNESFVPCSEERPKKSKKKKLKAHSEICLDQSLQNGVLEDSALTEYNVLESFGVNSETVPEDTPRKRKKHKRLSEVLDPPLKSAYGEASGMSEEAQLDKLIKQETPKQKKHKKRHHNVSPMNDNGAAAAEDSIIMAGQEFVEPKVKKKQKK